MISSDTDLILTCIMDLLEGLGMSGGGLWSGGWGGGGGLTRSH